MFKTTINSHDIILKKLLLASCTLLFLIEALSVSNVRKTVVVRISEIFNLPLVKNLRRKPLSIPIPYYHNSTSAGRIIFSGDIELNSGPKNPMKYPKGTSQRKPSQTAVCETNTKWLSCIYCRNETHLLCSSSYNIKIKDSRTPAIWTCSKCYFRELPFAFLRDIEDVI